MHNRFDRFAKDLLSEVYGTFGIAQTELEIAADPQRADLCFIPNPTAPRAPPELSLFARMAVGPCLVEPYREPPARNELRDCVRKQLGWHHRSRLQAEREAEGAELARGEPEFPSLWILSSGRPDAVMGGFALRRAEEWPPGVYAGPLPDLPFWLVVLNELPEERGTLLLRLLGRGGTLRRAIRDLASLPADAWELRHAAPILIKLRIETAEARAHRLLTEEEEELIVTAQEIVESIKNEGRQEGLQPLFHLFVRKLGRALTDGERGIVRQRLKSLGPDRLGDVAVDFDGEALAAWLADPNAA